MPQVSTWVAHASRQPSMAMLTSIDEWWKRAVGETAHERRLLPAPGTCMFRVGPAHALVLAHVDRASHKRRRRTVFISRDECDSPGPTAHGPSPMNSVIVGDACEPQPLVVNHSGQGSALHYAYQLVECEPHVLAVPVLTEAEFSDPEHYHEHSSKQHELLKGGVVLPFLCVPATGTPEIDDVVADREDLLRAHGYSSYTIDIDLDTLDLDVHREFAILIEDVCDQISGIKADAALGVLSTYPLWPIVVLRITGSWELSPAV